MEDGQEKKAKRHDFRAEHDRLVANVRAARGGDAGPPLPPPLDDRVECPTCHRKFAEEALQRHMGTCARMKTGRGMR
jgi:hypothetical protein